MALIALSALQGHAETGATGDTYQDRQFASMSGTSTIFGRYTIGVRARPIGFPREKDHAQ